MKTELSNNILLKFFNKELPLQEMTRIGIIINGSDEYKRKISDLKVIYSLVNEKEKLEENPYLYMEIANKINESKNVKNMYYSCFVKKVFQPILAISLIVITLYTGYNIGNVNNDTATLNQKTEIYFNDLQLEKFETILLKKD